MIRFLQRRFALSKKGAVDLLTGSLYCALQNISFMIPAALLFSLVRDLVNGTLSGRGMFYSLGSLGCAALIVVCSVYQYNGTFFATYRETGVRRIALAERLRRIPLSFFGKRDLADLTSSIMNDCAVLETAQSHAVAPLLGAMVSTVLIAIALVCCNVRMGLAAVWVVPVAIAVVCCASGMQKRLSQRVSAAKIACEEGIQEAMECMGDLCSNNAQDRYLDGLEQKIRAVENRIIRSEFGTAAFVTSASLILRLGIATTALCGASLLKSGQIDMLTYFLYLLVVARLYEPLDGAVQNLAVIIATDTNVKRMNSILDCPIQTGATALTNDGCDVVFDHVAFSYEDGEHVLRDVSFTAKQGQVTALVGPSGGGKTTVSRLAARFWDADSGRITLGGMDVSKIDPEALLSQYSIVFQDVTLFNGSVMDNIRIGRRGATDKEVRAAAKLANVDEFAEKLPEGWDTDIGENGSFLSGGERQRISIARAFLKDAPVILLDEATASLDVENETAIQSALSRLIRGKTVLVIAHRMRTVEGADKVVVLKDGVVAEQGSPEALLKKDGVFARMAARQRRSAAWTIGK